MKAGISQVLLCLNRTPESTLPRNVNRQRSHNNELSNVWGLSDMALRLFGCQITSTGTPEIGAAFTA